MKENSESIPGVYLNTKPKWQMAKDRVLNAYKYKRLKLFLKGNLVYLLTSHILSLQIGTTKFQEDYVSPLVIITLLHSTYYKLSHLDY